MQNTTHDTQDIVTAIIGMKGQTIEQMFARLEEQFPGVDREQLGLAIGQARTAMLKEAAECFEEADALDEIAAMRRRQA